MPRGRCVRSRRRWWRARDTRRSTRPPFAAPGTCTSNPRLRKELPWRSRCCSPSIFVIRKRYRCRETRCSNRETRALMSQTTPTAPAFVERNRTPYDSVLDTVGWTPLIRLNKVTRGMRTPVYAKAEIFNPGGSVKDRIGLPIIERAERDGRLKPGGTIVEGTSGNTGVALAIAAALRGYRCIFTMPDKMSQEKVRLLKAFGADVIITPTAVPPDHPDSRATGSRRGLQAVWERDHHRPVGRCRRCVRDRWRVGCRTGGRAQAARLLQSGRDHRRARTEHGKAKLRDRVRAGDG